VTDPIILPFKVQTSLDTAGGKGMNLSHLYRAGFPVPPGFILSTAAYRAFVQIHDLTVRIEAELSGVSMEDFAAVEAASQAIRAAFRAHPLPQELAAALQRAYRDLARHVAAPGAAGVVPVAVRSSATAEDLPGFSFAGQQDTYLNVIGESALQTAIVDGWSSLWTARAIGYRARNAIDHTAASMAVVVQVMVPSETSGVLFTANPLTGRRDEMVIDATFGLGEALVSGQVEPDHYVINADGQVVTRTLGSKAVAIHGRVGGGTVVVDRGPAPSAAISDATISELVRLGRRVAELFGAPQDIEWARADGELCLLQSRPITTLYPLPEGMPAEPLRVLFSLATVQGVLDPISPLGRDVIGGAIIGLGALVGKPLTLDTQTLVWEAGERLWIDFTGLVRNRVGRRLLMAAFPTVDAATSQALARLIEQGRFPAPNPLRLRTILSLLRVVLLIAYRMLRTVLRPKVERERLLDRFDAMIDDYERRFAGTSSFAERVALIRRATHEVFYDALPRFIPRFGIGMGTYNLLSKLAASLPENTVDPRIMMRSVPRNVTTEMDLALWETAEAIHADPESRAHFQAYEAATLVDHARQNTLPKTAQDVIAHFMERYGMRGWVEIDVGRPRWQEEPLPVFQTLRTYLEVADRDQTPDVVYQRGKQAAETEIERLVSALRATPGGRIKAWAARLAAHHMRTLVGLREAPKFTVVRLFGIIRQAILADGRHMVEEGVMQQPDDLFFLHISDLTALTSGVQRDWISLVQARRQTFQREKQRGRVPRLLLSDGETVYEGIAAPVTEDDGAIHGDPVSPGVVEGIVRVVLNPHDAQLAPGEILVCPGTDPSWTPLFLAAGGLVMEVGGMMTHGAVVAREYGLPAVVGVDRVTQRLQTGQRVRMDGSKGQIVVLSD
jgi:pyruvate,water dikinase